MSEVWLAEPADGACMGISYGVFYAGMTGVGSVLYVVERDDEVAAQAAPDEPTRRWWRKQAHGMSGPYTWAHLLKDAVAVYRLTLVGVASNV